MLCGGQKICFVAKANCYGFGSKLCKYFDESVDYFAVSSAYEFFDLKRYVTKPILILDPIYEEKTLKKLIENDAEITVSNTEQIEKLINLANSLNKKISIHIAINTGMNRFGIKDINEFCKLINVLKKTQNLIVKGIFSHYFLAKNKKIDIFQQNRLKFFINIYMQNFESLPLIHLCASEGTMLSKFGDMFRIGYGLYSDENFNTLTLKSKILEIQTLKKNESAGYGGVYVSKNVSRLAVVGIGYGDGIFRNIVKYGYVLVNDRLAKIVAICMDCMMVDITKIDCKINDDVIIIGKSKKNKISICDIATWCDTIGYEIIVRLSQRIERKYIGEKDANNHRKI